MIGYLINLINQKIQVRILAAAPAMISTARLKEAKKKRGKIRKDPKDEFFAPRQRLVSLE